MDHVLIVDVAPVPRAPFGIHKAVWDEIEEVRFTLPAVKDRTGNECVAYIEPLAAGDESPHMALFLPKYLQVMAPLAATYQAAWVAGPEALRVAAQPVGGAAGFVAKPL